MPEDFAKHTLVLPYNDIDAIEDAFEKMGNEIAGVIIEPVAGKYGLYHLKTDICRKFER